MSVKRPCWMLHVQVSGGILGLLCPFPTHGQIPIWLLQWWTWWMAKTGKGGPVGHLLGPNKTAESAQLCWHGSRMRGSLPVNMFVRTINSNKDCVVDLYMYTVNVMANLIHSQIFYCFLMSVNKAIVSLLHTLIHCLTENWCVHIGSICLMCFHGCHMKTINLTF